MDWSCEPWGGYGDSGIAFEYAIHEAVLRREAAVLNRISDALSKCRVSTSDPTSIFFAIEKQGSQQLIETQIDLITDDSSVLSGTRGKPVKLKKHMTALASSFRKKNAGLNLPQSINGLWKADLFLGATSSDHWVGTTVKINPAQLEAARGLRIAIVPSQQGRSDSIYHNEAKNLIVCPIPYDQSFMETFREGWQIVQILCRTDFAMPGDAALPQALQRQAAKVFTDRRAFTIREVLETTSAFAQPHLLETLDEAVRSTPYNVEVEPQTSTVVSPVPLLSA